MDRLIADFQLLESICLANNIKSETCSMIVDILEMQYNKTNKINIKEIIMKIGVKPNIVNTWVEAFIQKITKSETNLRIMFNVPVTGEYVSYFMRLPLSKLDVNKIYQALGMPIPTDDDIDIPIDGELDLPEYSKWKTTVEIRPVVSSKDPSFMNVGDIREFKGQPAVTPFTRF